jgi:hypothetical protein
MRWVDKKIKYELTLWIGLILVVNAIVCIWIRFVIDSISREIIFPSKDAFTEGFLSYQTTLALWNNVYVIVIIAATALAITSIMSPLLNPLPDRLGKRMTNKRMMSDVRARANASKAKNDKQFRAKL